MYRCERMFGKVGVEFRDNLIEEADMNDLGSLGALGVVITLLAGITSEVAEQLFGGFIRGKLMYWAALVTGVAVTFGAQVLAIQVPALQPLTSLSWQVTVVVGVVVGFVSTKLHGALTTANPGTETASLSGVVKSVAKRIGGNTAQSEVERATTELWDIQKAYTDKQVSKADTLAAIETWKQKYPNWSMLIPPGFPAEPQ